MSGSCVILSLGCGVQSSTLALMVLRGELPPIEAAIFADTGAEPSIVMRWLDWLTETCKPAFPIVRVMKRRGMTRDIQEALSGVRTRCGHPPFFTQGGGQVRRQCTGDFKLEPIRQMTQLIRQKRPVEQWVGYSADEPSRAARMIDATKTGAMPKYITPKFPLIEKGLTRRDCLRWCVLHDYPLPPRSACVYCPFRRNDEWQMLQQTDPAGWAEAVRIDKLIRKGLPGVRETPYVHRSLKPLDEVDLRDDEQRGQGVLFPGGIKCDGLCVD